MADVNNDGIDDVVAVNSGSNDFGVLLVIGSAEAWTFTQGPRLVSGQGPVHTIVADATADGVPDIIVANERTNDVYVLPGRGGGFFDDRSESVNVFSLAAGSRPVQSFVSGSGLATINSGSNSLTFFPGMNPNVYSSISTQGQRPVSAVLGNFTSIGDWNSSLLTKSMGTRTTRGFPKIGATTCGLHTTNRASCLQRSQTKLAPAYPSLFLPLVQLPLVVAQLNLFPTGTRSSSASLKANSPPNCQHAINRPDFPPTIETLTHE